MPKSISQLPLLILSIASAALLISCGANTQVISSGGSSGSAGGSGGGSTSTPPITGHLAVADGGDNRILIYGTPLSANESASVVIGQTSFTEGSPNQGNANPSAATLDNPWGFGDGFIRQFMGGGQSKLPRARISAAVY